MSAVIALTDEEWDEQYKPVRNHFYPANDEQQLFETYGQELEFVQNTDPAYVWTQLDGDDGGIYIVNGYVYVNRIGYYITAKPHDPHKFISICVLSPEEEEFIHD